MLSLRWQWGRQENLSQTAVNIHRWSYTGGRWGLHLGVFWIGYKRRSHEKRQTAREVGVHRETSRGSHAKYVCSLSVDGGSKAFVSENWAVEDWIRDGERKIPEWAGDQQCHWVAALAHKLLSHIITFFGVPSTWQILKIVSISLAPGKSGRRVYTSAMIQPTAHTSMGEL